MGCEERRSQLDAAQHRIPATSSHPQELSAYSNHSGPWSQIMLPTLAECLENARQCEWYAERATDEKDRKFLLRKAKDWAKLARERELEIAASTRTAAA